MSEKIPPDPKTVTLEIVPIQEEFQFKDTAEPEKLLSEERQEPPSFDVEDNVKHQETALKLEIKAAQQFPQEDFSPSTEVKEADSEYPELSPKAFRASRDEALDRGTRDHTPKEERNVLRSLINSAKEKFGWYSAAEENLADRSRQLDAELSKEMGKIEKGFRFMGEKYNTLDWKAKVVLGTALGLGAGAALASGAVLPGALLLLGTAAQRSLGLSTMFLKYEKKTAEGKWQKEKALGKAMLYTASMTGAMMLLAEGTKEGIEYAKEHDWGTHIKEWLGNVRGFMNSGPKAPDLNGAPPEPVATHIPPMHTGTLAHASITPEAAIPSANVEMPVVHATPGRGYEDMLQRLAHELKEKHITLSGNADKNSDLYQLLHGKFQDIALKHGFYNPDGTSAQIDPSAHLTLGTDGQVHLADATHSDIVHATEGMGTTPAYHPEVLSAQATPETLAPHAVPPSVPVVEHLEVSPILEVPLAPEVLPMTAPHVEVSHMIPHIQTPAHAPLNVAPEIAPHAAETFPMTDASLQNDAVSTTPLAPESLSVEVPAPHVPESLLPMEHALPSAAETFPLGDAFPNEVVPTPLTPESLPTDAHVPTIEHTVPAPETNASHMADSLVNHFGIEVSSSAPHLYADKAHHILAFGGTPQEKIKMVAEYLTKNPDNTVFSSDDNGQYRMAWRFVNGQVVPQGLVRTHGFFGFGSSFMKAPDPTEFKEILK